LGVIILPRNNDTKLPAENTHITDAENGMSVKNAHEGHVDCVLEHGTVHSEFIPQGQAANSGFYEQLWQCLREAVQWENMCCHIPQKWQNSRMLHGVTCCISFFICPFLMGEIFPCYRNQSLLPPCHCVTSGWSPIQKNNENEEI
jgi:hypothetical protein